MAAVYPARWTRGRIIQQALQKVGNTKITPLARDQLNRVLEDLYVQWEWPFLYTVTTLTLSGALVDLPADFLKSESDDTGLRVITGPANQALDLAVLQKSPPEYARMATPTSQTGRPRIWYHDHANNRAVLWPTPDGPYLAQIVYKALPPDFPVDPIEAYDADIPLFPYGMLLAHKLEVWALEYEQRTQLAMVRNQEFEQALDRVRGAAQPRQSQEMQIPLDEGTFGPCFRDDDGAA